MQVQSTRPLSKLVVVSVAVVAAVVGIVNLKFKFYFKFFKFQIFSRAIIFQDKSYLQAVLVAVCFSATLRQHRSVFRRSGSNTRRSRSRSRCWFQSFKDKIKIIWLVKSRKKMEKLPEARNMMDENSMSNN